MKKVLLTAATAASLLSAMSPAYAEDLLTGDKKLACEATLCLSSGDRPSECNESIHKYFSIRHKKMHKTLEERRNFLKQCPANNENNMSSLVNALVKGAGRCDAAELNRMMRITQNVRVYKQFRGERGSGYYETVPKTIIRNDKPRYCKAYFEHGWTTVAEKVKYVGNEQSGGRWVDIK